MGLTTLTEREREWHEIKERALKAGEEWERCDECLRYHPAGYEGPCENPDMRLPRKPEELES